PLRLLFAEPTVARLARALGELAPAAEGGGGEGPPSALVPLQPHGELPPLLCVHPIGGGVQGFLALPRHLGPAQPVYGLQAASLDRVAGGAHAAVAEMAAAYLKDVRALRPRGPYRLAGLSFGGLVAFEMACQLEAAGEEVDLLAILDTWVPLG